MILIVDDSEINRSLLSDMLADEYEIIEAENGMEASAILHEHEQDISLMLLDIMMPVLANPNIFSVISSVSLYR